MQVKILLHRGVFKPIQGQAPPPLSAFGVAGGRIHESPKGNGGMLRGSLGPKNQQAHFQLLKNTCLFSPCWVLKGIDFTTGSVFLFFKGDVSLNSLPEFPDTFRGPILVVNNQSVSWGLDTFWVWTILVVNNHHFTLLGAISRRAPHVQGTVCC